MFSVAGALLAIPVGIKRKSLAPLVFFGTTGTMLDIIMGITACEREHAERQMKLLENQNSAADASLAETGSQSWYGYGQVPWMLAVCFSCLTWKDIPFWVFESPHVTLFWLHVHSFHGKASDFEVVFDIICPYKFTTE